ncbi:MAG: glutamine synthetase, partial [Gammaproteobacteria bacterium]|nr:glutamine synthetase [Gammaproteobacteria bacterium]
QYAMTEDLWDNDDFLEDVRRTCAQQNIPMTTVHSEFSPGQFEINLHHVSDPVLACDHGVLLRRIIKGVARKHGTSATFMAKPFDGIAGSGMHIHLSLYDKEGNNIFSDPGQPVPAVNDTFRHAVGGLAETMASSMAIFAPTANSYRRLVPGTYAPLTPNWGYNHRDVALRIPVSQDKDRRIEHRVSSADANPYLVMAAIAAGIHHGLTHACEPGEMIREYQKLEEEIITLPRQLPEALKVFKEHSILPAYFGQQFCDLFYDIRMSEWEEFSKRVSNIDYEWYLRSI